MVKTLPLNSDAPYRYSTWYTAPVLQGLWFRDFTVKSRCNCDCEVSWEVSCTHVRGSMEFLVQILARFDWAGEVNFNNFLSGPSRSKATGGGQEDAPALTTHACVILHDA